MDCLNWDLTILSRAVAYPNLSTAAMHVGLSQPQLSRIVARLEGDLGLVLLDREAKRKSGWTPPALRLADACSRATRGLTKDLQRLAETAEPRELRIGALEGLLPLASKLAQGLFERSRVRTLEVDVLDLNPLEEQFLSGELDLLLTVREPGRRKFRNALRLGYQALERVAPKESRVEVMSPFEFRAKAQPALRARRGTDASQQLAARAARVDRALRRKGNAAVSRSPDPKLAGGAAGLSLRA